MEKFCSNPLCENHITVLYGNKIVRNKNGERQNIDRHLYRCSSDDEMWLCSVCHKAVNMVETL